MYTMTRQRAKRFRYGHAGLGDAFSVSDIQSDLQNNGCGDVKAMQAGLNKLGYAQPALVVDGIVGPATAAALTNFGINSNPTVNSNWCAAVASAIQQPSVAPGQAPVTGFKLANINPNVLLMASKGMIIRKPLQRSGMIASAETWWTAQPTTTKVGVAVGGIAAVGLLAYLLI